MKHKALSSLLLSTAVAHGSTTLIDVTFPTGTGTNPTFTEIDNGLGSSSWTQATGVLSTGGGVTNTSVGAVSAQTADFTVLGADSFVLEVSVASTSFSILNANGMFVGFQDSNASDGTGLWNNHSPSFGLWLGGTAGGVAQREVSFGGNAGAGRHQEVGYGVATLPSISDGFDVTLTIDSAGWDLTLDGLLDADGGAITGGSGTWASTDYSFGDFTADMHVGTSVQTPASDGDVVLDRVTLNQVSIPEPSSFLLGALASLMLLKRRR